MIDHGLSGRDCSSGRPSSQVCECPDGQSSAQRPQRRTSRIATAFASVLTLVLIRGWRGHPARSASTRRPGGPARSSRSSSLTTLATTAAWDLDRDGNQQLTLQQRNAQRTTHRQHVRCGCRLTSSTTPRSSSTIAPVAWAWGAAPPHVFVHIFCSDLFSRCRWLALSRLRGRC